MPAGLKAQPVRLFGCDFRSKTEATYAALFQFFNLDADYEPADGGFAHPGWLPDFVIWPDEVGIDPTLLDVKWYPRHWTADNRKLLATFRKLREAWDAGDVAEQRKLYGMSPRLGVLAGDLDTLTDEDDAIGWVLSTDRLGVVRPVEELRPLTWDDLMPWDDELGPDLAPYIALAGAKSISGLWAACRRVVNKRGKRLQKAEIEPIWADPDRFICPECGGPKKAYYETCWFCAED